MSDNDGAGWRWTKTEDGGYVSGPEVCSCGASTFPCAHDEWLAANVEQTEGDQPMSERRRAIQAHLAEQEAKVQAMSAASDDVRLAMSVIGQWDVDDHGTYHDLAEKFAAALAAEREKARAPFRRLADELSSGSTGNRETAELICAVAKGKSLAEWRAEDDR